MDRVVVEKSSYISYKWVSDGPALVAKAEVLGELFRTEKQPERRSSKDYEAAFNAVLTATEVMGAYDNRLLHIPTNNNLYNGKSRRSYSYTNEILHVVKWLVEHGYLEKVQGIKFTEAEPGEKSRQLPYAYKLSGKWKREIAKEPLSDPNLIRRNSTVARYVELRDTVKGEKRVVEPSVSDLEKHSGMIVETEKLLSAYDEFMKGVEVSLGTKALTSAATSMTRIFSRASFELGGRLYSELQNLTRQERPYLYFGGEPTIEIDYGSLHPHLLYHSEGLEFPDEDPYDIEGFGRDEVKKAFNMFLNRVARPSEKSAASSIVYFLGYDIEKARLLEDKIMELHSPIKNHFNCSEGLRLQRLDSDIAMKIIDDFINIERRPIIGVHDSFIVSVRDTETLKLLMNDCYNDLLDNEGKDVVDMVGMRRICSKSLDFSDELSRAALQCFEGETDGMDDKFWDELIGREPVQELGIASAED